MLRNFFYLIEYGPGKAYAIDPWDGEFIERFLKHQGLTLSGIINTHEHHDHVRGNKYLARTYGTKIMGHPNAVGLIDGLTETLPGGTEIDLDGQGKLRVLDTPGHTMAHLCLALEEKGKVTALFSGDTVMNAGVGNCHNGGDPKVLFETIANQILSFDDDVILYPGHDYIRNNLAFTLSVEPGNELAKTMSENEDWLLWQSGKKKSDLGLERKVNSFFRYKEEAIRKTVNVCDDDQQVFIKLRELRNKW